MRTNDLFSCLLCPALFAAACDGGAGRPPYAAPTANTSSDASTIDTSPDAGSDADADRPADAGGDGDAAAVDAGFDRPESTGLAALDVPECLADLFIDPEALRGFVADLTGANEFMISGSPGRIDERWSASGRAQTRAYLSARYRELGFEVAEHAYDTGANLVAERAGDDDAFFVVSAHLDAVAGSPGADDDASGLATSFAIAAALQDCALTHTLRVIAFDEEELGLVGSSAYAEELADEQDRVLGQIQLEMTGYDSDGDGAYLLVHCDMPESEAIANTVIAAVGTLELPLRNKNYCTGASDHSHLWSYGLPAIAMGEFFFSFERQGPADPNPCYHSACDTADALDYEYMADLTTATALAVATLVGAK